MMVVVGVYFIAMPLVVVGSVIATIVYRKNRLKEAIDEPPFDFQQTDEILIDPTTGIKQRVWFNPNTGERYYQNITDRNSRNRR